MRLVLLPFLLVFAFVAAHAQVQDDFNDGDFTNNPTWTGDAVEWEVLNGELHLNNATPAGANNSYLSTPSQALDNATWEFLVRLDFNPSSANFVDIFLASDISDLEGNMNGYFVRLGGTTDEISLYETTGGSNSEIIDGTDDKLDVGNPIAWVRVTRDALGNWELLSDTSGTGMNLVSEGTVTDLSHSSSAWFGIHTRYSSTRNTWCYLDSVNVTFVPVADTIPPTVVSVTPTSNTELTVDFSEDVDVTTATTLTNYTLNFSTNPTAASIDPGDSSQVNLTFALPFQVCQSENLAITNVEDRAGNAMLTTTETFTFAVAGTVNFKGVILNELFPDPTPQVGLPTEEFVELYNRSNTVVDLSGWTFSDGGTPVTITSDPYLLCPGEYVILADDSSLWSSFGPVIQTNIPALNNSGDPLGLRDNNGTLIDTVEYELSWYGADSLDDGGYTLELINPTDTCAAGASNWTASTDPLGGTPGSANSVLNLSPDLTAPALLSITITGANSLQVCFDEALDPGAASVLTNYSADNGLGSPTSAVAVGTGLDCVDLVFATAIDTGTLYTLTINGVSDCKGNAGSNLSGQFIIPGPSAFRSLIINEIFADPDTNETNLPNAEYIELYNRSSAVVDLLDWTFSDASSTISLPTFLLQPGNYVAITPNDNVAALSAFGGAVLGVSSLPSLNNSGDQLGLRDPLGNLVDTLAYNQDQYQDPNKEDGGYSLELVNPEDTCSLIGNWIASNDPDGGTPGAQNSVFDNTPDIQAPVLLGITILGQTTLEVCFDETMDTGTLSGTGNYTIDNGLGNPTQATPQGPFFDCVVLDLANPIDTGTTYTINFAGINDCKGNSIGLLSATFVQGGSAAPFQVVINEIMADPTPVVGLPDVEYIEVYNTGTTVVDLGGWFLDDPSSTNAVFPTYNLLPGEYVVVCDDSDIDSFPGVTVLGTPSFPTLNVSGDSLRLFDLNSNLIDFVNYDDEWYQDESKEDGGYALERIDPTFLCDNAGNWRASEDPSGGTPGAQNSVFGTFDDSQAPSVTVAQFQTLSSIRLFFDEGMDESSLLDVQNYSIDQGIGTPLVASAVSGNTQAVDLLIAGAFQDNTVYCVTVSNVQDCAGNPVGAENTACFGIPLPIEIGDLILNEILFNPYTGGSDFVELYNNSDKILDLSTVFIGEYDQENDSIFNEDQVSSGQLLLLPGNYICLTADRQFQIDTYQPIDPDAIFEMDGFPTYDDNEGEAVIRTDSGVVLDRFFYLDDYQFPNLDDDNGVSLERQDFDRPTQDEDNWHSAASTVLFATPGYQNSQVLVPSPDPEEVWLEPTTFSPDQDGIDDVLSVNYLFQTSGWNTRINVFDNKGRLVRQLVENTLLGTEGGTFTWDGTDDRGNKVGVGIYVVLVESSNPNTGETQNFKLGCVVAARFGN